MKVLQRFPITKESELIFAKRELAARLAQENFPSKDIFTFALMELGTNLIKHAGGGEIWLLKNRSFLLAALDRGPGIEDLQWAMKKGNTTYQSSLGLGLHQLSQNQAFTFHIFSKKDFGTAAILHQEPNEPVHCSLALIEPYNGDFYAKKGRFHLFGDASGHGRKAFQSAQLIKELFLKTPISCLFVEDFFTALDQEIKKQKLRGAVLSIVETSSRYILLCGVGDLQCLSNNERKSLKNGIVGVAFSSSSHYKWERPSDFILASDGITVDLSLLQSIPDPYLRATAGLFYSDAKDDRSIFIIKD